MVQLECKDVDELKKDDNTKDTCLGRTGKGKKQEGEVGKLAVPNLLAFVLVHLALFPLHLLTVAGWSQHTEIGLQEGCSSWPPGRLWELVVNGANWAYAISFCSPPPIPGSLIAHGESALVFLLQLGRHPAASVPSRVIVGPTRASPGPALPQNALDPKSLPPPPE